MDELAAWKALLGPVGADLLAAARGMDLQAPASIERLRRQYPPELVSAAIELCLARSAAGAKFGAQAQSLIADRQGVQMASSPLAAAHKALRFKSRTPSDTPVLDLCSGIGADAMAFTRAGIRTVGLDRSPLRAWMTEQNAGCRAIAGDITEINLPDGLIHIDPQRRFGPHRQIPRLEDLQPPFEWIIRLISQRPGACVKLFPGVDPHALPEGEVEYLSERGRLSQALLWTGLLADGTRSATNLSAGTTLSGQPGRPPSGPISPFIHAVDPAAERADLLGELARRHDLTTPHPGTGLLTGPAPIESPFLTAFRLVEDIPWSLKRVRQRLRAHDAGIVEIKTRGRVIEPDAVQKKLRGSGSNRLTVFILRIGTPVRALITHRCNTSTLSVS